MENLKSNNRSIEEVQEAAANREHLSSIESVPSSEALPSANEVQEQIENAIENGTITSVSIESDEAKDARYSHISTSIRLDDNEIDSSKLSDDEKRFGIVGKSFEEIENLLVKKNITLDKSVHEMHSAIVRGVMYNKNHSWHLAEPSIENLVKDGSISQAFEITSSSGENAKIANFSEVDIDDAQKEKILNVVKKVSALSNGKALEALSAICIVPGETLGGNTIGKARGMSGVVQLHEGLLDGSIQRQIEENNHEQLHSKLDISVLEATLTHELWHLLELEDSQYSAYAKSTGWSSEDRDIINDYGDIVGKTVESLDMNPQELSVYNNGEMTTVNAKEEFGSEIINSARPVTRYGHTSNREDSAEAFIPYTHSDREDYTTLDTIRRGAITGILQRVGETQPAGPDHIEINNIDPRNLISIRPGIAAIREPMYNYPAASSEDIYQETTDPEDMYREKDKKVVDDYGNEIETRTREIRYI